MNLGLKPAVANATIVKTSGTQPNPAGNSPQAVMAETGNGGYQGLAGNLSAAKAELNRG